MDSDWNRVWPHPEDYEFGLIEIVNSEFVDRMIESSPYRSHLPGERLGGVLKEADVHHSGRRRWGDTRRRYPDQGNYRSG